MRAERLPTGRGLAALPVAIVVLLVLRSALPNGMPWGIVVLGAVYGALSSFTALGLVLLYRSSRVINFAQVEIGALAASFAVIGVTAWGLPYALAVPSGLLVALAVGWLIEATVVRRFFTAPRLILTVATLGVAQVLGAAIVALPTVVGQLKPLSTFTTPFQFQQRIGLVVFTGDHLIAVLAVPAMLALLAWFFGRTDLGIAVRAAADSNERALLLGIPVRRLSRASWIIAGGLSGLASILTAPLLGPSIGTSAGPKALLVPLAAAMLARMESFRVAVAASIGIGIAQQVVFWNFPRSSAVDVALFVLILFALLKQRRRQTRGVDGLSSVLSVEEPRPLSANVRSMPQIRRARWVISGAAVVAAVLVPQALNLSQLTFLAQTAIFGIIAVSLVLLTGWAGQMSLGQVAFAGVGGAVTAYLLVSAQLDMFLALAVAACVAGLTSVLVGIPALRTSGVFFGTTTLALAVPVATVLLNPQYFPALNPVRIERPVLLQRFSLENELSYAYVCLAALGLALTAAMNFRRARSGRALVAVRDNDRNAAAFGVSPARIKLIAFLLAGALAGVAGGLQVVLHRGMSASAFSADTSLKLFTMVVIGGLGSLSGAILGAVYVQSAFYFLHGAWQLLATGAGLLVLLMVLPTGIGGAVFKVRDRAIAFWLRRIDPDPEHSDEDPTGAVPLVDGRLEPAQADDASAVDAILSCREIHAAYGTAPVLHGVSLDLRQGEVLALLGTNGAGKSSILRVISGLLPTSTAGSVMLDGRDLTSTSVVDRVKQGLVVVPGGRGVFPSLTVDDNLRVASWLSRKDQHFVEETTARVFELFPRLEERRQELAGSLSGGEQQMLAIAQALYCKPRILMIDELSLGLAPAVVASLLSVLRQLAAEGMSIIVVEQSVNVATSLADRAVFLERGQVRFAGPTAQLAQRDDIVRAVFFTPAGSTTRPSGKAARPRAVGPDAAIEVAGISKRFGGVHALEQVSLHASRGEIVGIIGSNGAGKTTLFDVLSGFLGPDEGSVHVHGRDVTQMEPASRAERGLGRLFQDARLFPSMSVAETLAVALDRSVAVRDPLAGTLRLGAAVDSERVVSRRVDELIERFNLEQFRHALISELSTGTRRVVELAGAIAHRPSVLLLDEPSSGLAQREIESLGSVLADLRDELDATFVIIEHDVPLVSALSDRLVCMHLGSVLTAGDPETVLSDPEVVRSYLGHDDATITRSGRGSQTPETRQPRKARGRRNVVPSEMAARGATE